MSSTAERSHVEGDMDPNNADVDMSAADDDAVKELDEMKKRLKEMEEEAAALRKMQAKVEKEMGSVQDPATGHIDIYRLVKRKITIPRTKLDVLQSLLLELSKKQIILDRSGKEMNRRQDMLKSLSSKANQMATTLNMSSSNIDDLMGPDKKSKDVMNRATGLDSQGLVGFQRQIMKEQGVDMGKLEETVTVHIALTINEELGLHTKLLEMSLLLVAWRDVDDKALMDNIMRLNASYTLFHLLQWPLQYLASIRSLLWLIECSRE